MLVLEAPAESPAEGGSPDPPPLSLGEVQREGAVLLPPPPFPLASPERERETDWVAAGRLPRLVMLPKANQKSRNSSV